MCAVAQLKCPPNSHPFQERLVSMHETVKIGRSVARARPAPNNAIFDCKVLSRNHALLWYENDQFFMQDTKSSNGTFVNNQRLSKGSEESSPQQIFSGDVIQFGVDVMENARKVTHGCIIANIQLFHPDGSEAKRTADNVTDGPTVKSHEIFQLSQYLQEAVYQEQMLEHKFGILQDLVENTQSASESGWQVLIDEDRLLSRLETLENQIQAYSKEQTEDKLLAEITALQKDKFEYETASKDSLRKILHEKLDAVKKLQELENSLANTEQECNHLKVLCESSQNELHKLTEKHQEKIEEVEKLSGQLNDAKTSYIEAADHAQVESMELHKKLKEKVAEEGVLQVKIESLQAENDFTMQQLNSIKQKMECKNGDGDDEELAQVEMQLNALNESLSNTDDVIGPDVPNKIVEKLKNTQKQIQIYKGQLKLCELRLKESKDLVEILQENLDKAKGQAATQMQIIHKFEEKLKVSDLHMNKVVEDALSDLQSQLHEAHKLSNNSNHLRHSLQEDILRLDGSVNSDEDVTNSNLVISSSEGSLNNPDNLQLKLEIQRLRDLVKQGQELQLRKDEEISRCQQEIDDLRALSIKSDSEMKKLQTVYEEAINQAKGNAGNANHVQDQLNKAESTTQEVKQQIIALRECLDDELQRHSAEMHLVTKQLQEAQFCNKQSKLECEQLRVKVMSLEEELEQQKQPISESVNINTQGINLTDDSKSPNSLTISNDYVSLKKECSALRQRIIDIEQEMTKSRFENHQLKTDYTELRESYQELEALRDKLKNKEMTWKINLTDAHNDSEQTKQELQEANEKISKLKEECSQCREENADLYNEIESEYSQLAFQTRLLSFLSMLPLLLLFFAMLLGLAPILSSVTATSS